MISVQFRNRFGKIVWLYDCSLSLSFVTIIFLMFSICGRREKYTYCCCCFSFCCCWTTLLICSHYQFKISVPFLISRKFTSIRRVNERQIKLWETRPLDVAVFFNNRRVQVIASIHSYIFHFVCQFLEIVQFFSNFKHFYTFYISRFPWLH